MSQFGSVPPESQFDPSQDIPFDQEYALAPDQSAMLDAGSYNFDPSAPEQPEEQAPMAFPTVRGGGMPSYSPQEMLQLSQTPVPTTTRSLPGLPSDEELDEMRPSESQLAFRSSDVEIKDWEANKGGESGDSAIDVLWKQLSGQEDQQIQKDESMGISSELQMTPEQLSPKRTQAQLEEGTRQERQMQGVNEWRYMFNPVITMNKGFDTVLEKKHVARQIARGDYSDPSVRQHFLSQEYGVPAGFAEKAFDRAAIGLLPVAMIPEFLLKTMPAVVIDKVFGGTATTQMVLEEAAAYARYSQNLQDNKLTSDSFAGSLVLDLIETSPQIVAQYAAALGTGGTSSLASVAVFAAMGAGQSATSQYFESLNTNIEAGVPLRDASMRAFRDAAIAGVVTGATEAVVGKIVGVGGLSGKTVASVRKALAETTLKTYVKGAAFGIIPEGTQETGDQFGSEFLINLIRSGEAEFKEFYDANPDWVMQTAKNSLYAGLVGAIIGAPSGVVTRFQNKREAGGLVSTLDQIKGALPENDPRIRMLNRESMTSEEMIGIIKWMGDQEKKLGIRSAKDIQAEKAIGAGLDMDGVADEQLSAVIIAGNDGTTTARLRGAPNEKVGKYGNVDFVITPAMAADELTRRGVMQGATPAGARTSLVANQGAVDPNTAVVEDQVYESGSDQGANEDSMFMGQDAAATYVSTGASEESATDFVRENPVLAARLARMTQPISRKMMEQMAGRSFAGNSHMFRQTFQDAVRRNVEEQQQARDPRRIQEGVDNSRRQAREEAVRSLTGLSDAEISRVALGVNPRRAKAISRILADAQRDATNVAAGPMTFAETERRAQTAEAAAAIRKNQTGSDIASIPALSQIASGDVARNRQAKLAKEKLDKVNANRKEVINSYTLFNTVTAVKTLLQDSLDNYRDAVINGTESQRLDAWLQCEAAWQVYNEARADPNIANDFNHAEITENVLVTRRFGQSKFGPTLQALSEQEKELNFQSSVERAKPAFAKIKEDAQTEAVYQVERDEAASHEDPNWITTRDSAVNSLTENADEQTLQDLADVVASDSAMGVEMRQRMESNLTLDALPAASEGADTAQAERRINARIDAIRRTGDGVEIKYEGGFGKGSKFAEEKQAMADSLVADQAVLQESLAAAKLERQTIRRELDTFIEAAWKIPATKNKPAKRRKKRTEATQEEVALSRKLAKVEEQITGIEKQIDDISTQLGIETVKVPNPKGVKQTDTFATTTTDDRAASIARAKQQVAELNDLNPADIEFRYDDGETKLTKRERALVEFGNNIGVTVVIMKTPEGSMTAGAYSKGVVYIDYRDVGRPSAWLSIAMHESMHHLAETNPEYFKDMYNLLVSKMPKAMKAIRAVYMQKFDLQAQRSAVRRAGLVVFNNESDKYQAGLLWLIRNDESQDFKTLRENLPDQLAAALDNEGLSGMVVPEREAVNEARTYFKRELVKADRAKMTSAEMRQEEVANLAEMLMDASFVGIIGKDGKVDMEAIRKLAKSSRATGLFAKLASAITDAMTAIPMLGKNRALNETQARRLREFADNPKELANPRTRQAAQVMIAKALVHMMDAKRGKIPINGVPANPMSDAYAADKIPVLRQSIRNSNAGVAEELPNAGLYSVGDPSPASVTAFNKLQRSIPPKEQRLSQAIRQINSYDNPLELGEVGKDLIQERLGLGITDAMVLRDKKTGKKYYFKFSYQEEGLTDAARDFAQASPSWRAEAEQDDTSPRPDVQLTGLRQEFKNEVFANLIAESLGARSLKPTFAKLSILDANLEPVVYTGIVTEWSESLKVGKTAQTSVFRAITKLPIFQLLQMTDMHPANHRSNGDPIDYGGSLGVYGGAFGRQPFVDEATGEFDIQDFISRVYIGITPDLTQGVINDDLYALLDYTSGREEDEKQLGGDMRKRSSGFLFGGSTRFTEALADFYRSSKTKPIEQARLELGDQLLSLMFEGNAAKEVFYGVPVLRANQNQMIGIPYEGTIPSSFVGMFRNNREEAAKGVEVAFNLLEKFSESSDIADAVEATQWGDGLKISKGRKKAENPADFLTEVLDSKTEALKRSFALVASLYRNADPNTAGEAFDEKAIFDAFENSPANPDYTGTENKTGAYKRIKKAQNVKALADADLRDAQARLDAAEARANAEAAARINKFLDGAEARLDAGINKRNDDEELWIGGTPATENTSDGVARVEASIAREVALRRLSTGRGTTEIVADARAKFNEENGLSQSLRTNKERDRDYDTAVKVARETGDYGPAQRMVDAAADRAGYKIKSFHGTNAEPFEWFDKEMGGSVTGGQSAYLGFFSTDNKQIAQIYADNIGMGGAFALSLNLGSLAEQRNKIVEQEEIKKLVAISELARQAPNDYLNKFYKDLETKTRNEPVFKQMVDLGLEKGLFTQAVLDEMLATKARREGAPLLEVDPGFAALNQKYADAMAVVNKAIMSQLIETLPNRRILNLRLRMERPAVYDAGGKSPANFPLTPKIEESIKRGNDGVVFENIIDPELPATHYVVFDTEQIKSGEPITFDENGQVVPLSQRFNPERRELSQSIRQRNARSTVDIMQAPNDQLARRNVGRLNENRPVGEVVANKVRDIGVALSRRTIDAGLELQPGDVSPESVKALAAIVADEVEWQVNNSKFGDTGTGVGWYSVNWPAAITALGDIFPELATNEEARTVFSAIVAITSSGTKVRDNFNNAVKIYAQVRNGKKLSKVRIGNQRSEQMTEKLGQLEELIDQHGFAKLRSHLLQTTTVRDINARLRAAGQKTNNDYLAETIVPYSAIYFGPKLGMFYANLMGGDNYLTMDLWWSRSINRMRGLLEPEPTESAIARFRELVGEDAPKNKYQLFDLADEYRNNYKNRVAPWRKAGYITRLEEALGRKEGATNKDKKSFERLAQKQLGAKPKVLNRLKREHRAEKTANTIAKEAFERLEEAPFNATDRKFMIDIANLAQANLAKRGIDLTISDIQAALWYYEKRLYGRLRGGGEQDIGYDEAAKEYIAANGNRSAGSSLLFNTGSVQRSGAKGAVKAVSGTVQRPAKKRTKDSLSQSIRRGEVNTGEPANLADADEIVRQALASPEALRNQAETLSNAWLGTVRQLATRYVPRLVSTDDEGIEVITKPADISPFWKFVAAPLNLAIGSKNADVISVVEDMIDMDVQRNLITESRQSEAEAVWNMIPKAERDSQEFAQVMDTYHPPSTIDSNPLFASKSQQWRDALKWFKNREEVRRQEIVDTKRDAISSMLSRDNSARIVSRAAEYGQTWEVTRNDRGRRVIRTDDGIVTVPEAREKLAKLMMPDNWGRQYAHFFHWFGGEYKLAGYNSDGTRQIIGSANSEPEAYERLYAYKKANPGMYVRYTAEPAVAINPDELVRMSDAQRRRLERMLADATGAYRDDVADAMRGIVGSKTSKRPFYAPLMERTGAKGFETDFMKVWDMSERLHNRWSMGGRMVKELTPRIDAIRRDTPGWGDYLSESIRHTLYTAPTSTEAMFDSMIRSIPVIGKIAGPFITRRLLGALRALNYGRQLLTVRQQVVNSFQPLQTVYPILGEKGMMEAIAFYNSEEGKDVLKRHGQFDGKARFKEGSETVLGTDIVEFVSKMNNNIYKMTNENFNPSSEARNQNFSFVAMYWHGLQKGMTDAEAARYGRVYGNVYTQFYYTKANIPWLLRGPIASTSLQYRRFAINSTGLLINEFQKGNYSGAARYMAIMSMLGGINASIGFSVASLIRSAYMGDKEGADDLNYKLLQFFKSNLGSEKAANVAMMGLPAAIGLDLSGSISIWQKPFGRNIYEKIGATVSGPTINTMLQAMTNLTAETAVPMSITERGSRAILDSSPTAQQAIALWKAFSGENSTYDARGRLMYKLDPYDQFMKTGAFRTVSETVWNMEYQRLRIIRNEVDSYADKAATLLAGGDTAGARTVLRKFNSLYPMAAMTFKDIQTRVKNKELSRTTPQLDRRLDVETGTIARKIAKKEGIGN